MIKDISVLIATYNRAAELKRTLEGMVLADKGDLSIEFIVIDNGSTDGTRAVVDSFSKQLPIKYILELNPGKSKALNTAIDTSELGRIVAFTDDDVDPSKDWLTSISSISEKWLDYSVFGGKINISFPVEKVPKWATDPLVTDFCFAYHNYSNIECLYEGRYHPFGPNFWVRKSIFESKYRFSEKIGPFPNKMILGEDTLFFQNLIDDGYRIVYSPNAIITHRVRIEMMKLSKIFLRAYQQGRGMRYIIGTDDRDQLGKHWIILKKNYSAWKLYRYAAILFHTYKLICSFTLSKKEHRTLNIVKAMRNLGFRVEALRLLREKTLA